MFGITATTRGDAAIHAGLAALARRLAGPFADPGAIQSIVAAAILDNMAGECGPDGTRWPELSDRYATWKATIAPGAPMGVLYGTMTQVENMEGVAVASGTTMTMTYGVDPVAIEHAVKFTEGGLVTGTSQPPRPFFGLTARAVDDLDGYFAREFARLIP